MDPLKQMNLETSDRLRSILNTPVMRSRLVGQIRPDLLSSALPDGTEVDAGSAGGGTTTPSRGLPVWAMVALAGVGGVGAAFLVWGRK